MNTIQTNYQALNSEENEVPRQFHAVSGGKSRWNHIGDLDTFFRRIYTYQQKHGLLYILLQDTFYLLLFIIIWFCIIVYAFNCIWFDFDTPPSPLSNKTDLHFSDLFIDVRTCAENWSLLIWLNVVIGIVITLYKCYKLWHTFCCYYDIKLFYNSILRIKDNDIDSTSWHEVQRKVQEAQLEQQMCVHKTVLTELDIYHRILRHENYMVAMVNKNILPLKYNIKFLGEWTYLTSALEFNIQYLLFNSYASPFKETGRLRDDYKKSQKRTELANELKRNITIFSALNFLFMPAIFVYNSLYIILTYAGVIRSSPSSLSTRMWTSYSQLYLRHFNELPHELHARLCRANEAAREYMKSFSSPALVIIFKFTGQVVGFLTVFFLGWSLVKEQLLMIDNFLLIETVGTVIVLVAYSCIPDENVIYYPDKLMKRIIGDIHYVPDHFKERANTFTVRDEFSQLFQYKFVGLFLELISPFVTPFILYYYLRPKALEIVDFFRCFTFEVIGVGDVCSFALMDVSRHGNKHWLSAKHIKEGRHHEQQQAEDGKTELSLIHFTLMNPHWQPPASSNMFIQDFKENVAIVKEQELLPEDPYYASLHSLSTMGSKYASLVNSVQYSHQLPGTGSHTFSNPQGGSERVASLRGITKIEGPPYAVQGLLFSSLHAGMGGTESLQPDLQLNPMELRTADMSFSALYIHEAHHKLVGSSKSQGDHHRQPLQEVDNNDEESSPLLEIRTEPKLPDTLFV